VRTPSPFAKVTPSVELLEHHLALHVRTCPQASFVLTTCPCGMAEATVCQECWTVLVVSAPKGRWCAHAAHATGGDSP
jgi:hypothetical protein